MPLFVEGFSSPANAILDVVVAVAMVRLLGWHWAFFPGFVAELIPGFDLFPTWTASVWWVTWGADRASGGRVERPSKQP